MRIGHGYDAHRIEVGKPLILGGIQIPSKFGLMAHSDGDVLVHALADAVLGAAGERDIGFHFPDSDIDNKNIDSCIILKKALSLVSTHGLAIEYADCTIIAQSPKLSEYIDIMRNNLAEVMNLSPYLINIKATTEEKMGFTGRGEGISAHAVCLLK